MSRDRLDLVLDRLAVRSAEPETTLGGALCATCVDVLEVPGAAITLQLPGGRPHSIGASNGVMADLEELERTLGEGPCIDAYRQGAPIAAPDLADPHATRWPTFSARALEAGARAAFGYPLQVGTARFGALNLYADRAGPLSDRQHDDAVLLADITTHAVLSNLSSPSDLTASELLDAGGDPMEVHQATGMISVQASLSIQAARARLRDRAVAEGRPISAIAADVVARRVRFDP